MDRGAEMVEAVAALRAQSFELIDRLHARRATESRDLRGVLVELQTVANHLGSVELLLDMRTVGRRAA